MNWQTAQNQKINRHIPVQLTDVISGSWTRPDNNRVFKYLYRLNRGASSEITDEFCDDCEHIIPVGHTLLKECYLEISKKVKKCGFALGHVKLVFYLA